MPNVGDTPARSGPGSISTTPSATRSRISRASPFTSSPMYSGFPAAPVTRPRSAGPGWPPARPATSSCTAGSGNGPSTTCTAP